MGRSSSELLAGIHLALSLTLRLDTCHDRSREVEDGGGKFKVIKEIRDAILIKDVVVVQADGLVSRVLSEQP